MWWIHCRTHRLLQSHATNLTEIASPESPSSRSKLSSFPSVLPYDPRWSSSQAWGTCFQSYAAKRRTGDISHQGGGCLLEGTWEAQLSPTRFCCLLTAILLRKETRLGETLWSATPHWSAPGTPASSLQPHHIPPLLPAAPGTLQSTLPFACPSAYAEPATPPDPSPPWC